MNSMRRFTAAAALAALLCGYAAAEEYQGAKITSMGRGKIAFESGGQEFTLPVSLSLKVFDKEGKEHDPVTGTRFLAPGNIVNIKTKTSTRGSAREAAIVEIHFVSGKVVELPRTKAGADVKPDPNYKGIVLENNVREKDWNVYYARAKVGDFIEYRHGSDREPSRQEVVEVGPDFVLVAKVFYILGHRDEQRIKQRPFVEKPLPGAESAGKQRTPSSDSNKTAKSEPTTRKPSEKSKSKGTSKSSASKLTERAKAVAKGKSREPPPPREPETETITVGGRELVCTIRKNSAGTKEWICADVPFDGKVKDDSRLRYELTDFGWGK